MVVSTGLGNFAGNKHLGFASDFSSRPITFAIKSRISDIGY